MAATIRAHNLDALHTECAVRVSSYCAWEGIEEGGPSAAGLELVLRFVKWCVAACACVDAFSGHVLVVFAYEGSFGSLLAKDAELLWLVLVLYTVLSILLGMEAYQGSAEPATPHCSLRPGDSFCLLLWFRIVRPEREWLA